jgi:L-alanine-DL-glutamate epimerase-like enolase superfamily enzyme
MVRGFKPFIDNQALDIVHPDLAFAGGITGTRKIADYAYVFAGGTAQCRLARADLRERTLRRVHS